MDQLTQSNVRACVWWFFFFSICSRTREVDGPPVLLVLGGELVVKRCGTAVDPVCCGVAVVFAQPAVWQVQHGSPLEGLQAGRGNEA